MRELKHSATALLKRPIGNGVAALIGLIAAAACLLAFVFDWPLTMPVDFGALILSFVLCGVGTGIGLILLRHLVPRRAPETLFGGSCGVIVPPAPQAEIHAQTVECPPAGAETVRETRGVTETAAGRNTGGRQSISRYKIPETGGVIGLITMIGMGIMLFRVNIAWEFLCLAILASRGIALVLYWAGGRRQDSDISRYQAPVAGGVVGVLCMIGLGMVMVRFQFLRDFLGLAIAVGGVVALVLSWGRRRRANSSISFV